MHISNLPRHGALLRLRGVMHSCKQPGSVQRPRASQITPLLQHVSLCVPVCRVQVSSSRPLKVFVAQAKQSLHEQGEVCVSALGQG